MPTHRATLAYRECPYGAMDRRPAVSIAHAIFSQVRQRLRPLRALGPDSAIVPVAPTTPRAEDGKPAAGQRPGTRRSGLIRQSRPACIMEISIPDGARRCCQRQGGAGLRAVSRRVAGGVPLWPNGGSVFPAVSGRVVAPERFVFRLTETRPNQNTDPRRF